MGSANSCVNLGGNPELRQTKITQKALQYLETESCFHSSPDLQFAIRSAFLQYVFTYMSILFENKIIGLQNELTKCGILKNMTDYEDFWKLAQEEALGVEMKEKLQKIRFKCWYFFFLPHWGYLLLLAFGSRKWQVACFSAGLSS